MQEMLQNLVKNGLIAHTVLCYKTHGLIRATKQEEMPCTESFFLGAQFVSESEIADWLVSLAAGSKP